MSEDKQAASVGGEREAFEAAMRTLPDATGAIEHALQCFDSGQDRYYKEEGCSGVDLNSMFVVWRMAAELAALKGGREAVATKWDHGIQGVPPYGFTCHADRRDQWLAEGKEVYVMETAPPAQASAWVPEGVTMQQVLAAYDYATSHPDKYLRGTTNWCAAFAHSLNEQIAAAPTPGASDGKCGGVGPESKRICHSQEDNNGNA